MEIGFKNMHILMILHDYGLRNEKGAWDVIFVGVGAVIAHE